MPPARFYPRFRILEAFHVRLLLQLMGRSDRMLFLKGGVNLRLYYESERYSEDMDFDADAKLRDRLKRIIPKLVAHPAFLQPLRTLGLRSIALMEGPAKDTGTTLRFKMGLDIGGGQPEPTKVEISFRGDQKNAETPPAPAVAAEPFASVVADYVPPGEDWSKVLHYPHASALWQKVRALALRAQVQARDVFDLYHLDDPRFGEYPTALLRAHLSDDNLREAEARALDVDLHEFHETVVRYLPDDRRDAYAGRWDEMRAAVAYRLEAIRKSPYPAAPYTAAGPTADSEVIP